MSLAPNSYICGIHFPAGYPNKDHYSSSIFLGKPVVSKCYSRVSTNSSVAYSAMLTHPIDAHVEAARGEKIEELESTIKDREKAIGGLENLLSQSCAEVERLKFSVAKLRAVSASFLFYKDLSVDS